MIAASFSNPTWNEKGNNHQQYIQDLNDNFDKARDLVYNPKGLEKEVDWNKPWFAAAKRGLERTKQRHSWAIEGKKMNEVVQMSEEQLQARQQSRKEIDQT